MKKLKGLMYVVSTASGDKTHFILNESEAIYSWSEHYKRWVHSGHYRPEHMKVDSFARSCMVRGYRHIRATITVFNW